jgi:hypothetical protein
VRDYGKVFSRIWESADFRAMSEDGRTLTMYLLTCQHGTIAGVFRVPDGYACEDLQWPAERVAIAFKETLAKGFANRCETTKWVWVRKFLEWNPPENPNQVKAARKIAMSVPDGCDWKQAFMRVCGPSLGIEPPPNPNPSPTLPEPFLNQYQEQYQEQEQNTSGEGGKPPDLTKAELWTTGKSLLVEQGMAKAQCGSFVGKLCKDWTDAVVLEAVRITVVKRPADAATFLVATCQSLAGQRDRAEPGWRTEQRERTQIAAPGVAVGGKQADQFFIDAEVKRVATHSMD